MGNRSTANRPKNDKKSNKNRTKINRKSMKNGPEMVPGDPRSSSEATGGPKSRKKTRNGQFWEPPGDAWETQNSLKNGSKKRSKKGTFQKRYFSAILALFGTPGVDFHRFWVPKVISGAHCSGGFPVIGFIHVFWYFS